MTTITFSDDSLGLFISTMVGVVSASWCIALTVHPKVEKSEWDWAMLVLCVIATLTSVFMAFVMAFSSGVS